MDLEVQIKTNNDVLDIAKEKNISFVRLQFVDILGTPKNIIIPTNRLEEALEDGMPFDGSSVAGYATIRNLTKLQNLTQTVL